MDDLVIQTEHLAAPAAAWLAQRCRLITCPYDDNAFADRLPHAAALVIRTYTIVDESLLAGAPKLRVIGRAGTGLDNVDVAACRARHVDVVYTPEANTQAVGEYVLGLLTDALRPRTRLDAAVTGADWHRLRAESIGTRQLDEITLGILGLGRVGRTVASMATGLGIRVLYCDLLEIPADRRGGAEPVSVEDLFERADVVSLHVDGRPANRRYVGAALLARLKRDAVLINTSRGFVVDNEALAATLAARPDALALLDVHDPEPFDGRYPLLGLPNAWLYPHLASRTRTAMDAMSWVVRDVVAVLEGRPPHWPAPD